MLEEASTLSKLFENSVPLNWVLFYRAHFSDYLNYRRAQLQKLRVSKTVPGAAWVEVPPVIGVLDFLEAVKDVKPKWSRYVQKPRVFYGPGRKFKQFKPRIQSSLNGSNGEATNSDDVDATTVLTQCLGCFRQVDFEYKDLPPGFYLLADGKTYVVCPYHVSSSVTWESLTEVAWRNNEPGFFKWVFKTIGVGGSRTVQVGRYSPSMKVAGRVPPHWDGRVSSLPSGTYSVIGKRLCVVEDPVRYRKLGVEIHVGTDVGLQSALADGTSYYFYVGKVLGGAATSPYDLASNQYVAYWEPYPTSTGYGLASIPYSEACSLYDKGWRMMEYSNQWQSDSVDFAPVFFYSITGVGGGKKKKKPSHANPAGTLKGNGRYGVERPLSVRSVLKANEDVIGEATKRAALVATEVAKSFMPRPLEPVIDAASKVARGYVSRAYQKYLQGAGDYAFGPTIKMGSGVNEYDIKAAPARDVFAGREKLLDIIADGTSNNGVVTIVGSPSNYITPRLASYAENWQKYKYLQYVIEVVPYLTEYAGTGLPGRHALAEWTNPYEAFPTSTNPSLFQVMEQQENAIMVRMDKGLLLGTECDTSKGSSGTLYVVNSATAYDPPTCDAVHSDVVYAYSQSSAIPQGTLMCELYAVYSVKFYGEMQGRPASGYLHYVTQNGNYINPLYGGSVTTSFGTLDTGSVGSDALVTVSSESGQIILNQVPIGSNLRLTIVAELEVSTNLQGTTQGINITCVSSGLVSNFIETTPYTSYNFIVPTNVGGNTGTSGYVTAVSIYDFIVSKAGAIMSISSTGLPPVTNFPSYVDLKLEVVGIGYPAGPAPAVPGGL
jgi:hypothetical protein